MDSRSLIPQTVTRRGVVVAAVATGAAILLRSRPRDARPAALAADRTFPDSSCLTRSETLREVLANEQGAVNLLDASALANFRSRHIPGARHAWWQDTMELNSLFYGTVLKPDDDQTQGRRQRLLERWNIVGTLPTVVYDDSSGVSAARIAWFLRFLGVNATVLDGGLGAWLAAGGPTNGDQPEIRSGEIAPASPLQDYYLVVSQVADRLGDPNVQVVDLREIEERDSGRFQGFSIPSAALHPRSLLREEGVGIRSPQSMGASLANANVDLGRQLILMAPTGMEARPPWLALKAMGASRVVICDGGWQEWITKPGVPLQSLADAGTSPYGHLAHTGTGT